MISFDVIKTNKVNWIQRIQINKSMFPEIIEENTDKMRIKVLRLKCNI